MEIAIAIRPDGPFPEPAASSPVDLALEPFNLGLRFRSHKYNYTTGYTEWIGKQLLAVLA